MWKCPKCGREFRKKDQSHYCGKKPETIREYIDMQDEDIRPMLEAVYLAIHEALPDVQEKISWSMPTWYDGHNIIHFAASKKHIGIYPGPEAVEHFAAELDSRNISYAKGTIRIPYDHLHTDLITQIARWCLETGNHA